jgi:poly-gamma-glutamate capsule biosynthesis protein CapA/YwtB (metallophosphatase superfamily)
MAEAQDFETVPVESGSTQPEPSRVIRLFLCGDVMIGRGIDQVLRHSCDPALHESYVHSAMDYVDLAEAANGPIPRHVDPAYVWGAALDEWSRAPPDGRIINLETSVTRSDDYMPKGINYRVSPDNATCLAAGAIDCCVLANNHVLDWGRAGLMETLATLARLGIKTAGAGRNFDEAAAPAVLDFHRKSRVLVFSFACPSSGVSRSWAATGELPGINILDDLSPAGAARIVEEIERARRPGDVILVSIHWGPNWGYEVPEADRRFAHALIDNAGVSIVHGHSSHHAKGVEVYRNRLILYGCGDFLNDYEGIRGYEAYRDDLALMYFAGVDAASANVVSLEISPLQIRNFRLVRPSRRDVEWLQQMLDRESRRFGPRVVLDETGRLALSWSRSSGSLLHRGQKARGAAAL